MAYPQPSTSKQLKNVIEYVFVWSWLLVEAGDGEKGKREARGKKVSRIGRLRGRGRKL